MRAIGCSNLPAWQVVEAQWISRSRNLAAFVSCQDEYSLLVRDADKELMPAMKSYGLSLLPYFPLAGGLLTGKYRRHAPMPADGRLASSKNMADRYMIPAAWDVVEKLSAFAAARGKSLLDLAFSWLLARGAASVIAGATKPEQIEQNVGASAWKLSPEDLAEIEKLAPIGTVSVR